MTSKLLYQGLTSEIIGSAMKVHGKLGPGFVEKIYQRSLYLEFKNIGLRVEREKKVVVKYNRASVGYFKVDFVVGGIVVVELKATNEIGETHLAQMIS